MKKKLILSVILAVRNEEKHLRRCLESVQDIADEIVVVDGESADDTVKIALSYGANVISAKHEQMFHKNKQRALNKAKGKWVLQLDADEEIPQELAIEVLKTIQSKRAKDGYNIARKNYFGRYWMKKGGLYPDYVVRLFRRTKAQFPCKSVHEQIIINGEIGTLVHPMHHYTYGSVSDYWRKANAYIDLSIVDLKKHRKKPTFVAFVLKKPFSTFIALYIRHKGFMDGTYGFLFALFSALHHPLTYIRYKRDQ